MGRSSAGNSMLLKVLPQFTVFLIKFGNALVVVKLDGKRHGRAQDDGPLLTLDHDDAATIHAQKFANVLVQRQTAPSVDL